MCCVKSYCWGGKWDTSLLHARSLTYIELWKLSHCAPNVAARGVQWRVKYMYDSITRTTFTFKTIILPCYCTSQVCSGIGDIWIYFVFFSSICFQLYFSIVASKFGLFATKRKKTNRSASWEASSQQSQYKSLFNSECPKSWRSTFIITSYYLTVVWHLSSEALHMRM